jgi:hypothetical protein
VLATLTVALPDVIDIPPYRSVPPVAVPVAAALNTNCVAFVIDAIVAPFGMFGPLTGIPTTNPVVLVTDAVVLVLVVAKPAIVAVGRVPAPVNVNAPEPVAVAF